MTIAPFRLLRPSTVAEASRELARLGDEAKVYGGGSELLLIMRQGLLEYSHLVDVKGIPDLGALAWDDPVMRIGAAVTHRRIERSEDVARRLPLLQEAETHVANVRVRNIGTIGGNLAFGDPHSDAATALLAHDARARIGGAGGERLVSLEDFFVGLYETALEQDEVLIDIEVSPLPTDMRWAYLRVSHLERPTLTAAVAASLQDGRLGAVRMAVGCVGAVPARLRDLEDRLIGASVSEAQRMIRDSAGYLTDLLQPEDDLHGSGAYKLYLTTTLLRRGLAQIEATAGDNP